MILDGQQRITSLFYALYSPPKVTLKNTKGSYTFYLDLKHITTGEIEEAVVGVSSNSAKKKKEYEKKFENGEAIPVSLMMNDASFLQWLYRGKHPWQESDIEKIKKVYDNLSQFMVPVVTLPEETPKDDIVNIFERINRTGVGLSLFDLAVAQLYPNGVKLRELWKTFKKENSGTAKNIDGLSILRVIALAKDNEIRKRELLDALAQDSDFTQTWEECVECIKRADKRLKQHYCAFEDKWIPSKQLIVTLAAIIYRVKASLSSAGDYDLSELHYRKIDVWYWCSAFSQRYDSHYVTTAYTDVRKISDWVLSSEKIGEGEDFGEQGESTNQSRIDPPDWIKDFQASELKLDRVAKGSGTTTSIYKAAMTFLVTHGVRDFYNGQTSVTYSDCDDDHIFCKNLYAERMGQSIDSILNRTLITSSTNKQKSKKPTATFLDECLQKHGNSLENLQSTLGTHLISEQAFEALRNENYETFLSERLALFEARIMAVVSID